MGVIHKQIGQHGDFAWEGVAGEPYRASDASEEGCRMVLVGPREGAPHFAIRYFEIPPGGKTSLEQHAHDHGVVVLRGRARVVLGRETQEVGPGDAIYIRPDERHQFETLGDEPFGFLCVIPSKELLRELHRSRRDESAPR